MSTIFIIIIVLLIALFPLYSVRPRNHYDPYYRFPDRVDPRNRKH